MSGDHPWPESRERVYERVRGMVKSVLRPSELQELRLEWAAPPASPVGNHRSGPAELRLTVLARDDERFEVQLWGSDLAVDWEECLRQAASQLEDWVCETSFAWGEQRHAQVPS